MRLFFFVSPSLIDLFWLLEFVVWTSAIENLEIQWCSLLDHLNLLLLGCHLCWICGCNWILIIVVSLFGGSFPSSGWLRVTLPTMSYMLLCRCCQKKTTKHREQTCICKNISPPRNPTINSKCTIINKGIKILRLLLKERREINYNIKSSNLICTNLFNKKLMLKSYAGKKISLIMEKTTVDFISVASSIYHCFSFLDPPLVMWDVDPIWP